MNKGKMKYKSYIFFSRDRFGGLLSPLFSPHLRLLAKLNHELNYVGHGPYATISSRIILLL